MATMTLTGHVVRANKALAALVGRTVHELVGTPYSGLAAADGRRCGRPGPARRAGRSQRGRSVRVAGRPARSATLAAGDGRARPRRQGASAVPVRAEPGHHRAAPHGGSAAAERGAVPPARRGGAGLRDLHARPDRGDRQLERRARSASRATPRTKSSASTSGASTRPKCSRSSIRSTSWSSRCATATTRKKAGASARTAASSGPPSSSPPCTTRRASTSASPRSPETSKSGAACCSRPKRLRMPWPPPTPSWRPRTPGWPVRRPIRRSSSR